MRLAMSRTFEIITRVIVTVKIVMLASRWAAFVVGAQDGEFNYQARVAALVR
jgi:hypothetical protein